MRYPTGSQQATLHGPSVSRLNILYGHHLGLYEVTLESSALFGVS